MIINLFGYKKEYKFKEPKNTACFVCDHVMQKERDILFVSHDKEDSSWQFLCGQNDHSDDNIKIISIEEATEIDNTINDLFELPEGICAEREKIGMKWNPFKIIE